MLAVYFHLADHLHNRVKNNIHVGFHSLPVGYGRPDGGYSVVNCWRKEHISILPHFAQKALDNISAGKVLQLIQAS